MVCVLPGRRIVQYGRLGSASNNDSDSHLIYVLSDMVTFVFGLMKRAQLKEQVIIYACVRCLSLFTRPCRVAPMHARQPPQQSSAFHHFSSAYSPSTPPTYAHRIILLYRVSISRNYSTLTHLPSTSQWASNESDPSTSLPFPSPALVASPRPTHNRPHPCRTATLA